MRASHNPENRLPAGSGGRRGRILHTVDIFPHAIATGLTPEILCTRYLDYIYSCTATHYPAGEFRGWSRVPFALKQKEE